MHFTTAAVGMLLGSALAIPSPHHPHHPKYPFKPTFTGTAAAVTGSVSGAPYSINATAGAFSTGRYHHQGHGHQDHDKHEAANAEATGTASDSTSKDTGSADDAVAPVIEDKHKIAADTCGPATVTVTSNTVVTVTVSGGGATSSAPAGGAPTVGAISIASIPLESPESSATGAAAADATDSAPSSSLTVTPSTQAAPSFSPAAEASPSTAPSTAPSNDMPTKPAAGLKTKRGIIASGPNEDHVAAAFTNTKVCWLGDWFSAPPKTIASDLTFVPQNYGRQSDVKGEWTTNAVKAVAAGDKYMLSFGEPGTPNPKLYMDPQQGAQLFMDKMQPYANQGVTIGAPGTLQNKQDFAWLESFLDACTKCSIGFIALHWFDKAAGPNQVSAFQGTVTQAVAVAQKRGIPVWVDNFQATGTEADQMAFLKEVVPWLDGEKAVQAYAYVPTDDVGMTNPDGGLNDLGTLYATLK